MIIKMVKIIRRFLLNKVLDRDDSHYPNAVRIHCQQTDSSKAGFLLAVALGLIQTFLPAPTQAQSNCTQATMEGLYGADLMVQTEVFSYTGGAQTATAPDGAVGVCIKSWGAGGGREGGVYYPRQAGSGGYTEGTFDSSPGTQYAIIIGEGGISLNEGTISAYGFGGWGAHGNAGGLSGVFTGNSAVLATDMARALLVSGGGGASDHSGGTTYSSGSNGNGSNSGGEATLAGANERGYPGTGGIAPTNQCSPGGGGWFGGSITDFGGGAENSTYTNCSARGGSGGVAAGAQNAQILFTPDTFITAADIFPPMTGDPDYVSGIGVAPGTDNRHSNDGIGGDGLVVMVWALSGDLGDAPDSYLTLNASGGPIHWVDQDLLLGSLWLQDSDGRPTINADGDDNDGVDGDDEDGVTSFPTTSPGGIYTVAGISTYNNTGSDAMLCGWFDFNQDSTFYNTPNTSTTGDDPNVGSAVDSGERSCVVIADGTTSADLSWTIPTALRSTLDDFYFRFRLTTDADYLSGASLAPTGLAVNGEVEDYLVNVALPVELSYFGVEATNDGVLASWTTESETENLGFTLDRRVEGTQGWSQIATYQTNDALLGQGSTPSATDYEYLDALVEASTTYEYRLADVDYNNTVTYHATRTVTVGSTPSAREVPDEFTVKEAYPNPFNPSTTIEYYIPLNPPSKGDDAVGGISVQIYDITGKLINTLIDQVQPSGWHSVQWNGKDQVGANVPAGAYLVRVKAGTDVRHTKVMLLK